MTPLERIASRNNYCRKPKSEPTMPTAIAAGGSLHALVPIIVALLTYGPCVFGHHPHDPISAVAISPSYEKDSTLYISYSTHLLKSVNAGHSWQELSNGLDHSHRISSI